MVLFCQVWKSFLIKKKRSCYTLSWLWGECSEKTLLSAMWPGVSMKRKDRDNWDLGLNNLTFCTKAGGMSEKGPRVFPYCIAPRELIIAAGLRISLGRENAFFQARMVSEAYLCLKWFAESFALLSFRRTCAVACKIFLNK